jgi:hypothetical protein
MPKNMVTPMPFTFSLIEYAIKLDREEKMSVRKKQLAKMGKRKDPSENNTTESPIDTRCTSNSAITLERY